MIKHGSGIISVGMKEEDLQKLNLPLMSPETEEEDSSAPTFTITVVRSTPLILFIRKSLHFRFFEQSMNLVYIL